MSSESVSDKELDDIIGLQRSASAISKIFDAENPDIAPIDAGLNDKLVSALTELKSLRAQQAKPPAGCAEMATTIEKAIADADESGFDEGRCAIIQKVIAPLFAIPQGCALMARELSDLADDHVFCDQDGSAWVRSEYRGVIAAKLAPLFTLLADCRDRYVALRASIEEPPRTESVVETVQRQAAEIDKFDATLAKLDAALGKGDADGGREEVESE